MASTLLDRLLEPLAEDLNESRARRLAGLRADPELQDRIDELAKKSNEGTLTAAERAEYDRYRAAWHVVSILQLKARKFLKDAGKQ